MGTDLKRLGRRQKQILNVLSNGKVVQLCDIAYATAHLEVSENGKSANDAQQYIKSRLTWWKCDCQYALARLVARELIVKTSKGYYQLNLPF